MKTLFANKIYALLIMLAFILPNAYIIWKGKEEYPYTPAPMFGHYIGGQTRFYDIKFFAKGQLTRNEVLPFHKEFSNQLSIGRFFFDRVYGSVEPNTPLGDFSNESREKFEKRMENFCAVYFGYLKKDENKYRELELVVNQYDRKYNLLNSHLIGYYDINNNQFKHIWK